MERLAKLASMLPPEMDAALITALQNRRYYTGFPSSAGTVLVTREECYFIIDSRYFEAAEQRIKSCKVILQDKLSQQLQELLDKHGAKSLGLESDGITMREYLRYQEWFPGIELLADNRLSDLIVGQRQCKSQEEIRALQAVQDLADKTFTYILEYIKPGKTEREIALEMEYYSRKLGSAGPSFPFIVVSGKNGSMPHGVPSDKPVERGELLTMDFGCLVDGYPSDMTRTVAIGQVSEEQRQVYQTVLAAQLAALEHIRPGAVCSEVDKVARDYINNQDGGIYKGLFGHGLGHGMGLDVHESPAFNQICHEKLKVGMVMSVEPGIYLPGKFGVRIEDIIVVTEDGYRNFTASPKDLIVL